MASTPPKVSGSPETEAHRRWVEEQLRALQGQTSTTQKRVRAADKQSSAAASAAAQAAIKAAEQTDRTDFPTEGNRLARPLTDSTFWGAVIGGRRSTFSGMQSLARNVVVADGQIKLYPTSQEAAEIDVTGMNPVPISGKLYVAISYIEGFAPIEVWIDWRDGAGNVLTEPLGEPTQVTGFITTAPDFARTPGAQYSVRVTLPATVDEPTAEDAAYLTSITVFEVIGQDGLAISPGGISVEDDEGNKTVEINPTLPVLDPPTAPILASGAGSVSIHWNGSLFTGPTPGHLAYVYAEWATSSTGPWLRVGQPLNRAGDVIAHPPVGLRRWYRFTAMDTSNRPSTPSNVSDIVTAGIDIPDLTVDLSNNLATGFLDEYTVTDSQTVPPGPDAVWSSDTPDWEEGEFVWRRTRTSYLDGTFTYSEPISITGADGTPGEDAVLLRMSSSRGTSFKNNAISTVLSVTVFRGAQEITNITDLRAAFGTGAYIEWWWRRMDDEDFGVISSADPRLSMGGFALTVSPADVDEKTDFKAVLNT